MNVIPYLPLIEVLSKKQYDRGSMVNGAPIEKMAQFTLTLDVYRDWETLHCFDCGSAISKFQIFAHLPFSCPHCINCIILPDVEIIAKEATFQLNRKSKRHPDGKFKIRAVHYTARLQEHLDEIAKTYALIDVKTIWEMNHE
jgi:phage FluMu protein Com